jgi:hypothetical protein
MNDLKEQDQDQPTEAVTSYNYVGLATRTEHTPPVKLTPEQYVRLSMLASHIELIGHVLNVFKRQLFYMDPKSDGIASFDAAFRRQFQYPNDMPTIELDDRDSRLFHGILGKTTELAELWQSLGQYLLVRRGPSGPVPAELALDVVNVVEELSDDCWYDALILDALGKSFNTMLTANIDKLRKRYPDKFSQNDALNRDLKTERSALESHVQ